MHLSIRVGHLQIGVLLADEGRLRTIFRQQQLSHFVSRLLQIGMAGKGYLLLHQLVVGLHPILHEVVFGERHWYERIAFLLEDLVGKGNHLCNRHVHLVRQFFLMRQHLFPCHIGNLLPKCLHRDILFYFQLRQALIQRRASQRTVVDVDDYWRTIIEKIGLPLPILNLHGQQCILRCRAGEGKFAVGNCHAINGIACQIVYEIDLLAFISTGAADRIVELLSHARHHHYNKSKNQYTSSHILPYSIIVTVIHSSLRQRNGAKVHIYFGRNEEYHFFKHSAPAFYM